MNHSTDTLNRLLFDIKNNLDNPLSSDQSAPVKLLFFYYNPFYYPLNVKDSFAMQQSVERSVGQSKRFVFAGFQQYQKSIYWKTLLYWLVQNYISDSDANRQINQLIAQASESIFCKTKQAVQCVVVDESLLNVIRKNICHLWQDHADLFSYPASMSIAMQLNDIANHRFPEETGHNINKNKKKDNDQKRVERDDKMSSKQLQHVRQMHSGYPQLHPTLGRPTHQLLECYYNGCHNKFLSELDLDIHLRQSCGSKFIPGLHSSHVQQNLTPQDVHAHKLTRCPVLVCDKKHMQFMNEQHLIYHFQTLGIAPFWFPGWAEKPDQIALYEQYERDYKQTNESKQQVNEHKGLKDPIDSVDQKEEKQQQEPFKPNVQLIQLSSHINIWDETDEEASVCICCMTNRRTCILMPCNHQIMCSSCFEQLQRKICAVCRQTVQFTIPSLI